MQRRPRRLRVATAVALASLLVLCNVLAQRHEALAAHRRCVEHGELIDVASTAARSAAPVANGRIAARSTAAAGDEHEHCQLCPASFSPAVAARATLALALVPAWTPPLAPPRPVPQLVELVRIAPKTSPPV